MAEPGYPAARLVAATVQDHFARHLAAARGAGRTDLGAAPQADHIEAIIDAGFWASLRREEGATPTISLALLPPGHAGQALTFARWLPLRPAALAKLAPAVERPGIHLGVWPVDGQLRVWGTTRSIPAFCFVLEVLGSGLLVIKHRNVPFGKFVNIAVLEGDQIKIVDDRTAGPDCPGVLKALLGQHEVSRKGDSVNPLVHLAATMRLHQRGGALLIVPDGSNRWQESIVEPVVYAVSPRFTELAGLMARAAEERHTHEWQEDLKRAVEAIAGLTAVDGATIMTTGYELVAFGAKITRRDAAPSVEKVLVSEPIRNREPMELAVSQLGGTRHLSAAQFAQDQPDAVALVASQDGRFTIFKWSPGDGIVHAHRVEALLL